MGYLALVLGCLGIQLSGYEPLASLLKVAASTFGIVSFCTIYNQSIGAAFSSWISKLITIAIAILALVISGPVARIIVGATTALNASLFPNAVSVISYTITSILLAIIACGCILVFSAFRILEINVRAFRRNYFIRPILQRSNFHRPIVYSVSMFLAYSHCLLKDYSKLIVNLGHAFAAALAIGTLIAVLKPPDALSNYFYAIVKWSSFVENTVAASESIAPERWPEECIKAKSQVVAVATSPKLSKFVCHTSVVYCSNLPPDAVISFLPNNEVAILQDDWVIEAMPDFGLKVVNISVCRREKRYDFHVTVIR